MGLFVLVGGVPSQSALGAASSPKGGASAAAGGVLSRGENTGRVGDPPLQEGVNGSVTLLCEAAITDIHGYRWLAFLPG